MSVHVCEQKLCVSVCVRMCVRVSHGCHFVQVYDEHQELTTNTILTYLMFSLPFEHCPMCVRVWARVCACVSWLSLCTGV